MNGSLIISNLVPSHIHIFLVFSVAVIWYFLSNVHSHKTNVIFHWDWSLFKVSVLSIYEYICNISNTDCKTDNSQLAC